MNFVQGCGPSWRHGVIADNVSLAIEAGWTVHVAASGRTYISDPTGETYPVLCAELVRIDTEDGPETGRCGNFILDNDRACPGHAAELATWRGMSEAEHAEWERRYG